MKTVTYKAAVQHHHKLVAMLQARPFTCKWLSWISSAAYQKGWYASANLPYKKGYDDVEILYSGKYLTLIINDKREYKGRNIRTLFRIWRDFHPNIFGT